MSRPWRLRHKLVLGLALVVACVALLLGAAVLGLSSYAQTTDTDQRKIVEIQNVVQLRDAIQGLVKDPPAAADPSDRPRSLPDQQREHFNARLATARQVLEMYRQTHAYVLQTRLDPDDGEYEAGQMARIQDGFATLEQAVAGAAGFGTADNSLFQQPQVAEAHAGLMQLSTDLLLHLVEDVKVSIDRSKANHRRTLYVTGPAAGLAIVLVLTLLHYFRVWVFRPIRELQAGVHRVHRGNFDQPIKLSSKDELEELADEFNAMTARLRDIYKSLAQQVNERTRQLVRSERMVSVGFLAAGVAHEINNPLASIAFCSEALERRLQEVLARAPGDADTIGKYLRMIQQEAFRCKQITQKLLDFSRSGGKREPTELNGLIADVLEVAQHLPNARGKTFAFEPEGRVTALVSGPDVKSVVLNLVVNALDNMEDGGTLTAALAVRGEVAEMTFRDTGCGMTPEVLENIFEPFFTRTRTGNGTGLGLSISHQIVDQHGGSIHAGSDGPGRGSTFVVRLPLRAKEAAKPDPRETRPPPPRPADPPAVLPFPPARAVA